MCEKLSEDHPIMRAARNTDPNWKRLRLTSWENRALKAEAALRELTHMVEYGEQHTPNDFWRFIFGEPGSGFRHVSYRDAVNLLHEQIFNPERSTVRGRYDVAADIIGLFVEYRDRHGKAESEAKHCAATEYEESEDESMSGNSSTSASSGDSSTSASSGNSSTATASGKDTIAMAAGIGCAVSAGENGCFAAAYYDETLKRNRILVGYVGEDGIEADKLYVIQDGKWKEKA